MKIPHTRTTRWRGASVQAAGARGRVDPAAVIARRAPPASSERARLRQQRLQFAAAVQRHHPADAAVVAPADKRAADVESRHRRAALFLGELGAERVAVRDFVELDDLVFCTQLVKDLLGLDAEGSGSKRIHDGRRVRNLRFELRLDCGLVVVARLD